MSTVVQKFDADGRAVERELEKMRREYDKLMAKMEGVDRRSRKHSKDQVSGLESAIMSVGKMAATYQVLDKTLGAVNAELSRQYELQEKLAARQIKTAPTQADIARNIGADTTPAQLQSFIAELHKINKEQAFGNIDALQSAAASVLSATGADQKLTLEMLTAATQVFRDKPEQLATFAGGMGDVASSAGISAEEAAALMLAGQGQSRLTELGGMKHAVVALKSGQSHMKGIPKLQAAEEVMGLFAGLTIASGDAEGAETKTSTLTLLSKLAELGGEGSTAEKLERVRGRIRGGELDIKDVVSGFGTSQKGTITDLLLGEGEASRVVGRTLGEVSGSVAKFRNTSTLLRAGTPELKSFTEEASEISEKEAREQDPDERLKALKSQIRKIYRGARAEMDTYTLGGMMEPIFASDAVDHFTRLAPSQMAQNRIDALRRSQEAVRGTPDFDDLQKAIDSLTRKMDEAIILQRQDRNARARNAAAQAAVHTER